MVEIDGWSDFFKEIITLVDGAERQYGIANLNYSEHIMERLELSINACSSLLETITNSVVGSELEEYHSSLAELIQCLQTSCQRWGEYKSFLEGPWQRYYPLISTQPVRGRGRPRFQVSKSQLEYLESLSFKWTEIASILGLSRMTLYRLRLEYGLVRDPSDVISDEDLKDAIQQLRQFLPYCGVSMVWGNLRARGVKVARERVRSMLRTIDPLGRVLRCFPGSVRRQPYSVPGPNSLWHIDSHHKLIRWRMVTHGAIDGYSRLVLYLKCRPNNRSTTVYELFLTAVQNFNLPSRVRSDQGLENVAVARHMIEKRGSDRRSMLTGSSTHNQRIERLWRDMHSCVTLLFYKLFYYLEQQDLLNSLDDLNLWALHYVYLPRINRSLTEFIHSWNNHPIRTACHKTPQQLFTAGSLILQASNVEALDFVEAIDSNYGVDPGINVTPENETIVPENPIKFSDTDMQALRLAVNPLGMSDNHGIDVYEQTLQIVSTLNQI